MLFRSGKLLNAVRSAVASEQEKEREELKIEQREELEKLKLEPFPDFNQWQQHREEVERVVRVRVEQERESKPEQDYGGMSM